MPPQTEAELLDQCPTCSHCFRYVFSLIKFYKKPNQGIRHHGTEYYFDATEFDPAVSYTNPGRETRRSQDLPYSINLNNFTPGLAQTRSVEPCGSREYASISADSYPITSAYFEGSPLWGDQIFTSSFSEKDQTLQNTVLDFNPTAAFTDAEPLNFELLNNLVSSEMSYRLAYVPDTFRLDTTAFQYDPMMYCQSPQESESIAFSTSASPKNLTGFTIPSPDGTIPADDESQNSNQSEGSITSETPEHPNINNSHPKSASNCRFSCKANGCTRSYMRKSELVRHQKTHSGIRKHGCRFSACNRTGVNGFTRKDHLTQHLKQVHGISG